MKQIVTVTGPVLPERLGFCQSHEHLCILKGESFRQNPVLCIDDPALSALELCDYHQAGGDAVVDAQPVGCGRDPASLERMSRESGVSIIASTGFHKLMFYPETHWLRTLDETRLAALFSEELTAGMYAPCDDREPGARTSIRAGQIKTALDAEGLTPRYRPLFSAAAQAAAGTGAPLMVHVEEGSDPLELSDFLAARGVAYTQMIFCHLDRAVKDFAVHQALCRRGAFLEYDTIARPKYHDDAHELSLILSLLEAGYGERLLLSLDVTRARLKRYGGDVGLCYILETFLPLLRERGIDEVQVRRFFFENPAQAFAREG